MDTQPTKENVAAAAHSLTDLNMAIANAFCEVKNIPGSFDLGKVRRFLEKGAVESEGIQDAMQMFREMPTGVVFNNLHEIVARELVLFADRTNDKNVLREIVVRTRSNESPSHRDAALALTHLMVKKEGLIAAIQMSQSFLRSETANGTYVQVKKLLDSLIDSEIEKAVAEDNSRFLELNMKYLFELQSALWAVGDDARVPMAIGKIGIKMRDAAILKQLFEQMACTNYTSTTIVLKRLMYHAFDQPDSQVGDSKVLDFLSNCEMDDKMLEVVILTRVNLLYRQGLLT